MTESTFEGSGDRLKRLGRYMREELGQYARSDDVSGVAKATREALVKSISKRLRPVCSQMPATEFDAMAQQMADIELKYAN